MTKGKNIGWFKAGVAALVLSTFLSFWSNTSFAEHGEIRDGKHNTEEHSTYKLPKV